MREIELDARLLAAADLVRQGACFADIGTDHARLPLFLLASKRIGFAYACDVACGPLASAEAAIAAAGEGERCKTVLCDGAAALSEFGITDYAICGMGGELIARIISDAPQLADPSVRLVLQPMTRAAHLRRFLARNGFSVLCERFVIAAKRAYVCLSVAYTGRFCEISGLEAEIGSCPDGSPAFLAYARTRMSALRKEAAGAACRGAVSAAKEIADHNERILQSYETEREGS
jgi:tRNA (adenine22-N1)-methyltransferase